MTHSAENDHDSLSPEALEFLRDAEESCTVMSDVHADMTKRGIPIPKTDDVVREVRKEIALENK